MVLKVEDQKCEETNPMLNGNDIKNDLNPPKYPGCQDVNSLTINDPSEVFDLLRSAIKLQDVPASKECMQLLTNYLNKENVLDVLKNLSRCKASKNPNPSNYEPSAPPLNDSQTNLEWVHNLLDNFRNDCLLEIDKNADYVLRQANIVELDYRDVLSITSRDTLQVSREMLVYIAIMKWGHAECKRRSLDTQSVKTVLKELVYAPRYGLMSKEDFLCRTVEDVKGPDRSGILEEDETERILTYIKMKSKSQPAQELPYKGSQPRISGHKNSGSSNDNNCCDKHIINFLTCFTAIFD